MSAPDKKKRRVGGRHDTLKEFARIPPYRIRLLRPSGAAESSRNVVLDIRTWVETKTYRGFTGNAVRIHNMRDLDILIEVLNQVRADGRLPAV